MYFTSFPHFGNRKVSYPSNLDLSKPETLGLYATRNFHLNYEDADKKIRIAAWHIVPNHIAKRFHKQLQLSPETLKNFTNDSHYNDDPAENIYKVIEKTLPKNFDINSDDDKENLFEEILRKTEDPIVLYLHGNTGSRANSHRVDLYKTLRKLGYHVIALDYRGFADSSDISPTEDGCVNDAFAMYRYIKNLAHTPVFIYGHSLGNAITLMTSHSQSSSLCLYSSHLLKELELAYIWSQSSIKAILTTPKVLFLKRLLTT